MTVTGGPASGSTAPAVDDPPRGAAGPLLAGGALVLVAALVVAELLAPAAPPREPVRATAQLVARDVLVSRSGVLVVPVDLVNAGPAVQVVARDVVADPVGQPPATNGRTLLAAGGTGRVVALLQPDCARLHDTGLSAVLTVRLRTADRVEDELVVDVGADPAVARTVAGVCSGG